MPTVTLDISDKAFKRLRTDAMVRTMANVGGVQDIMHAVCIKIVKAKDGDVIEIKLRKEGE
jgi:hypothetical protein